MNLYEIPEKATILAPSYLHPFLQYRLLKEHKNLFDLHLKTPQAFLAETIGKEVNETAVLWQYYHKIKEILPALHILKRIAPTYAFLSEVHRFLVKQEQFAFDLSTLPNQSEVQRELALILHALADLAIMLDPASTSCSMLLSTKRDLSNVYILDCGYSFTQQQQIEALYALGAKRIDWYAYKPKLHFYHSINKRQEIESVADLILTKQYRAEDVQITVCDDSYKPFIKQIFSRHQIPHTILFEQRASLGMKAFVLLLTYAMTPDCAHLLALLDASLFPIKQLHALSTYLLIFEKELHDSFTHMEQAVISDDILSAYEVEELKQIEQKARIAKEELLLQLAPLQQDDLPALFHHCYDLLAQNRAYQSALPQIQTILQESMPYLNEKEDLSFLLAICDSFMKQERCEHYEGIMITDLNKPLLHTPIHIIMGCDQKHYPAFSGEKGFFDESYMEQVAYPALEQRYAHALKRLEKHHHNAQELYLFYAQGDFKGKSQEAAPEIELLADRTSVLYPLSQHDHERQEEICLRETTARQLFAPDQILKGSISAFERYVNCPFSYFVCYGLGIKEPLDVSFNVAKIGTLSHYAMEQMTRHYQKSYTKHKEALLPYLESKIQEIMQVYPNKEVLLSNILQRLHQNLQVLLGLLDDMEEQTSYAPAAFEHRFEEEIPTNQGILIRISGVIDRIDFYEHFLRIIDYKSSAKVLSLQNVLSGKQLQLLTYAYVAQKQFHKDVAGAYYQSLKNESITFPYGKIKRRPVAFHVYEEADALRDKLKKSGLKGWTTCEFLEALDHDGTHINGFSKNKDGAIQARTIYSMEGISEVLLQLYDAIVKQMMSGVIAPAPIKDACLFCHYHDICRYQGNNRELKALIEELPEHFYIKGGKQHEME